EQVVPIVDDDQLPARTLQGRVVDQILLGAVRPDVALECELAGDDLLDRDFLVPAVAAVFLFTAGLGHLFRAAERAPRLDDRLAWHGGNLQSTITPSGAQSRVRREKLIVDWKLMDRPTHAGLRHLALNVRDLDAMKRFYIDLLGFAVEWEPDP